jgi:hypothetical protein
MAQDPAQIRAQIEAVRARLEEDLDQFEPVVARRLRRARRVGQAGGLAGIALIVRRLLRGRKREQRGRARKRAGCCAKCHGKHRRR